MRPVFRARHPREVASAITITEVAELLRAAADGYAATGRTDQARQARRSARLIEGRDGVGPRKHVRTTLLPIVVGGQYGRDWRPVND